MHIPDGYLGPVSAATLDVAMLPLWTVASRRLRARLATRDASAIALAGSFCFVVMMFNVPTPGGTTAHPVGAALAAIALGPSAAMLAVSVALGIQAFMFGDGGVLALGANCINMAVVMPAAAFGVYQALTGGFTGTRVTLKRRVVASGVAAYVSINLAALAAAIELGLQPVLEPGHCPYGLGISIPAMLAPHLLIVGFIEAAVTMTAVRYLHAGASVQDERATGDLPALAASSSPSSVLPSTLPHSDSLPLPLPLPIPRSPATSGLVPRRATFPEPARALWAGIGVLCLTSPLGLIAAGTAWGEWAPAELTHRLGVVPPGLGQWSGWWNALLASYAVPGLHSRPLGYMLSAWIGVGAITLVVWMAGRVLLPRLKAQSHASAGLDRR